MGKEVQRRIEAEEKMVIRHEISGIPGPPYITGQRRSNFCHHMLDMGILTAEQFYFSLGDPFNLF